MYYITDNNITENKTDGSETALTYNSAIDILKRRRETIIKNAYQNEIDNRFSSNTTGALKWYDSKEADRNNLVGVVASDSDSHYKCYSTQVDTVGEWILHTKDQLKTVLNDGRVLMIQLIQKRDTLLNDITTATTKEDIVSINW